MSDSLSALYLSNPNLAVALRRRAEGQQLAQQGMDTSPTSWAGALARLAQAYLGQRDTNRADAAIKGAVADQQRQVDEFNRGSMPETAPIAPTSAPSVVPAPGASLDTSVPLADRLNNPGALRFAGQPNATNVNGFASFPTRDAGMEAADAQLALYGSRDGINTLAGAIGKWAPPNENDTKAYIARVAQGAGIDPNAPIDLTDRSVRAKILPHMFAVEGGARSVAGGGQAQPYQVASADGNVPPPSGEVPGIPSAPGGPPRASPLANVYLQQAMRLQQRAQQAAASPIPQIRQQAPVLMQQAQLYATLANEKPKTNVLRPGGMLVDDQGHVISQAPDNTGPLNVIQSGVDEKGNPRWVYATRPGAVGQPAPTPGPMVSIDQRGPNAEATERGTSLAKEGQAVREAATAAAGTIDQVRQLRTLGTETDRLASAREVLGSALDALGVKGTKAVRDASSLQAFNGALSNLVLGAQLAQKGVQTEGDAQRMREQYAKATNTMEANNLLMRATEAQATRQMEKADFYEQWYGEHKTYDGAQGAWNKFIRETPLTVKGANGVQFFNEFRDFARARGASDEQIAAAWKEQASRK